MLVHLKDLKPNPQRDYTVDPVDDERVAELTKSIKEDGFWGGVVCRKTKGGIEIAAGAHRVKAAITQADLFVARDMDDAQLIRVYARENATQRGNTGTAQAGTIAAAIRYLAKGVMTGAVEINSSSSLEKLQANIAGEQGIGRELILDLLSDVPSINDNVVRQQLAMLKSSGDYGRIIKEVKNEIERENRELIKDLERAEKERIAAEKAEAEAKAVKIEKARLAKAASDDLAQKRAKEAQLHAEANEKLASKRAEEAKKELAKFDALRTTVTTARNASDTANNVEITFDFEGVAQHLKMPAHIETFRKEVTGPGVKPFLPVKRQAALAAEIVRVNAKADVELTGRFIKDHIATMIHGVITESRKISREEKERAIRANWESTARELQKQAARQMYAMASAFRNMATHDKTRPSGVTLHLTGEFLSALKMAREALAKIKA